MNAQEDGLGQCELERVDWPAEEHGSERCPNQATGHAAIAAEDGTGQRVIEVCDVHRAVIAAEEAVFLASGETSEVRVKRQAWYREDPD